LEVIADSVMEEVLGEYYSDSLEKLLGSQSFCEKLAFIDRLN
jgi:hypothetical protein